MTATHASGHPGASTEAVKSLTDKPTKNRCNASQAKFHPLGPLTAQEITQSAGLIRGCWPDDVECHFKVVTLFEPAKPELLLYLAAERAGQDPRSIDRRAFVVYYFRGTVSQVLRACPPTKLIDNASSTTFTRPW